MRLTRLIPVFPAAILMLTALPATLHAQGADSPALCGQTGNTREDDANRYTTRSTMFGIGGTNRLETYLSPLEYTGPEVRFMRESIRMTRMWGGRVSTQQFYEGNFSYSKNPTKDSEYLSGDIDWRIGWHYNWTPLPALRLMAGLQTGLSCGFVYNTSNGNNPAQGKLSTNIAASGMAIYRFNWLRRRFSVRYQFDMPLAGLMFSPNYGQSYYEIFSLGHYDRNVCFTWPGNAPCFSQLLTVDVPIGSGTLRLGYRCDIRQSHVNNLKSHTWSNLFMIGFVKHFRLVKQRDNDSDKLIF